MNNRQINAMGTSREIFSHFSIGDDNSAATANPDARIHKPIASSDLQGEEHKRSTLSAQSTPQNNSNKVGQNLPLTSITNLPTKHDESHPLIPKPTAALEENQSVHTATAAQSEDTINNNNNNSKLSNTMNSSIAPTSQLSSSFTKNNNMKNAASSFKRSLRSNPDSLQLTSKTPSIQLSQSTPINSSTGLLGRVADIALETSIGQSSISTEEPKVNVEDSTIRQLISSSSNSGQAGYRYNSKSTEALPQSTDTTPTENSAVAAPKAKLVQVTEGASAFTRSSESSKIEIEPVTSIQSKDKQQQPATQSSAEAIATAVFTPTAELSKKDEDDEDNNMNNKGIGLRNRSAAKAAKLSSSQALSLSANSSELKKKAKTPQRKARVSRTDRATSSMNVKRQRFSGSSSELEEDDEDINNQEQEDEDEEISDKKRPGHNSGTARKQSISQQDERSVSEHGSNSWQQKQETKKRGKLKKRGIRDLTTEEKWQVYEDYDRIQSYRGVGRMFNMDHSTVKLLILRINQEYPGEKITKDMFLRGQIAQPAPELKITKKQKLELMKQAKQEEKLALEMQMRNSQLQDNLYIPGTNSPLHSAINNDDQIMLDNIEEPVRQNGNSAATAYEHEYQMPLQRQVQKKKSKSKKDGDTSQQSLTDPNFQQKAEDSEAQNDAYSQYANRYEEQQFENGGSIKLEGTEFFGVNSNAAYGSENPNGANTGSDQAPGDQKEKRKYITKASKTAKEGGIATLTKTISEEKGAKKKPKKKTLYESMQFMDDPSYNTDAEHGKMIDESTGGAQSGSTNNPATNAQSQRAAQNGSSSQTVNIYDIDINLQFEGQLNLLQQTEGQFMQQYQNGNYANNTGGYTQNEPNYEYEGLYDELQINLGHGNTHHQQQSQQQQQQYGADNQINDDDLKLEMS